MHSELFTWNSSQKKRLETNTFTRRSCTVCTFKFVVGVLSSAAGRTGCCYMTTPLHFAQFLSKSSWPRPPYSSDLAPDFFFFPRLKVKLLGHQFQSAEKIVTASREAMWYILANIFQHCFQQLYQCWQACIAANSSCFEENVNVCNCMYLIVGQTHSPQNY
jgi:hypothetical protein